MIFYPLVSLHFLIWSICWNLSQFSKGSDALDLGYHCTDHLLQETNSLIAWYSLRYRFVLCFCIVMFVANTIIKNRPKTSFLAVIVPKVTRALHFWYIFFNCCSCRRGEQISICSWEFNITGLCKDSLYELGFMDAKVGLDVKIPVWTPFLTLLYLLPVFSN